MITVSEQFMLGEYAFGVENLYDVRDYETALQILHDDIDKEHILSYEGYDTVLFASGTSRLYPDNLLSKYFYKNGGKEDIRAFILSRSTEDKAWTEKRNQGLRSVYYRKITFGDDICAYLKSEVEHAQKQLFEIKEKYQSEADAAAKAKAEMLTGVDWETKERTIYDEGGKTKEYLHYITINNKTHTLSERNVFDFGVVINMDGCLLDVGENGDLLLKTFNDKEGWITVRTGTPDEKRAYLIVVRYGKYAHAGIRM